MKKTYIAPECEIVAINNADVITSSPNGQEINLFAYGEEIELDGIGLE